MRPQSILLYHVRHVGRVRTVDAARLSVVTGERGARSREQCASVDATVCVRCRARRLALKGKALTAEERRACCQIVRPETILAWFRDLAAQKHDSSQVRKAGRPRKTVDIFKLVLELARDNPGYVKRTDMWSSDGVVAVTP